MNLIPIVNNREDLDHLIGTSEHDQFMDYLKGSMTRKQDTAVYPEGYGQPSYEGPVVEPVWTDIEDISTITRFGFTKTDF